MKQISKERQVYCYTMKGNHCLFADEIVKKHLIDRVGEIRLRDGWFLYAFCIMDDAAYFVIGANQITQVVRELQAAVQKQLGENDGADEGRLRRNTRIELSCHIRKLGTLLQIADCCRKIHRIPLELGYVSRLEDYWWSSYPSFAGLYEWDSLDSNWLFPAGTVLNNYACNNKNESIPKM
ncbi:MAG: hypothetical protein LUI39_01930 [Lachnospiraceae bacterium]|nr:hypothetical protein [Lachnospiraceae bacterium]